MIEPEKIIRHLARAEGKESNPPDYLAKTDVTIAACRSLLNTTFLREVYADVLAQVVLSPHNTVQVTGKKRYVGYIEQPAEDISFLINASAAQRAEALYMVVREHVLPENP